MTEISKRSRLDDLLASLKPGLLAFFAEAEKCACAYSIGLVDGLSDFGCEALHVYHDGESSDIDREKFRTEATTAQIHLMRYLATLPRDVATVALADTLQRYVLYHGAEKDEPNVRTADGVEYFGLNGDAWMLEQSLKKPSEQVKYCTRPIIRLFGKFHE